MRTNDTRVESNSDLVHMTLAQATVQHARKQQMAATDVLAALLQAGDTRAEARALIDSLSEEFFHISSTYLEMVRHLPLVPYRLHVCLEHRPQCLTLSPC